MAKGVYIAILLLTAVILVALRFAWYSYFNGVPLAGLPASVVAGLMGDPIVIGAALANALLITLGLAWFTGQSLGRSAGGGLMAALAVFVLFVATTIVQPYIYAGDLKVLAAPKPLLIDGGYLLVALLIAGVLGGLSQPRRRKKAGQRANLFTAPAEAAEH